jgi:HAD superfamily hydrolase (TIGR01509 family)
VTETDAASFSFAVAIFDVDGTLIDSNGAHAESWTRALTEHGVDVDPTKVRAAIGMGGDKLLRSIADIDNASALGQRIVDRKKAIFSRLLPSLHTTHGARDLLEFLRHRGVVLAIATSADDQELDAILEQAGVADLFPTRTSKDDAKESKPEPDIVKAALVKARVSPADAVMIGDTPYDIEAAQGAGVSALALRCGGYWTDDHFAGADRIFNDPEALHFHWTHVNSAVHG